MALPAKQQANTIRAHLSDDRVKKQLLLAIPKHMDVDRLLRVAMTSIQKNPKLMECTLPSLLGAVMTAGQLGLEPDGQTGQAYLVPYWNSKKNSFECQLIPGYRGLIALARRSGEITKVSSQVVYENDHFEIEFGTEDKLIHKPEIRGERGKAIGAYAVFHYRDGGPPAFDFMSLSDIEKIAKRSATYKNGKWSGPWATDTDEMRKKTVIRRTAKLQPVSIEFQRAVTLEDRHHAGESQMDIFGEDEDPIDVEAEPQGEIEESQQDQEQAESVFMQVHDSIPEDDLPLFAKFIAATAKANGCTMEKVEASVTEETKDAFVEQFTAFKAKFTEPADLDKARKKKTTKKDPEPPEEDRLVPCPNEDGEQRYASYCNSECKDREGCPSWPTE